MQNVLYSKVTKMISKLIWIKTQKIECAKLTTNIEKSEMCKHFSKYIFWNYYLIISLDIFKYQYGLSVDIFNVIFLLANNHRH